jgi:cytochrome c oxidase subunit 4
MSEHVASPKLYIFIFVTLLALTGLTTAIAYINLDAMFGLKNLPLNTIVALAIAICKATLVGLFFMHLRWSSNVMRLVVACAVFWMGILITLTAADFFTRNWTPIPRPWQASVTVQQPSGIVIPHRSLP